MIGTVRYDAPAPYMLMLFFHNQYGIFCSDYMKLEIEEDPAAHDE